MEPTEENPPTQEVMPAHGAGRLLVLLRLTAGLLFTGLALVGAFLPVLPTTPFLLLACWFFARSSPTALRRILSMPVFGPYVDQWRRERSIPAAAKRKAYLLVAVSFAVSVWAVDSPTQRGLLVVVALVLLLFLGRLPVAEARSAVGQPSQVDASSSRAPR